MTVFANNTAGTVTAGGTTAGSTSWTVGSVTGFPASLASGQTFHVADPALPGEKILVTAISGSGPYTWTVTRGDEGSTAVAHTAGFTVRQVVTAGEYANFRAVYNVVSFGAQGDGSADDTTAIQAALTAAAAASGGVVHVPAGTYLISQTLQVGTGTRLAGAGQGVSTIRLKASALSSMTQVGANTGAPMIATSGNTGQSRLAIGPGLTIDGNQANAGTLPAFADAAECCPVSLWNASLVTVEDIEVINPVGYAVYLNACTDSAVTGCRVVTGGASALATNQQDGIHVSTSSQIRVTGNDVDTGTGVPGDDAIALQCWTGTMTGVTVAGNVIRAAVHGVAVVEAGGSFLDIAIEDNVIWTSEAEGVIVYYGTGTVGTCTNVSITGNVIGKPGTAYASGGIAVEVPFSGVAISGNTINGIVSAAAAAILAVNSANTTASTDLTVSGNTVSAQPGFFGILAGSATASVQRVTVTGNLLDLSTSTVANEPVGVNLVNVNFATCAGNQIYGNGDSGSVGIWLTSATSHAAITGNSVSNAGFGVLEASGGGSDFNTYAANAMTGCTTPYTLQGTHDYVADTMVPAGAAGGIADAEQYACNSTPLTLTSTTALQKLFATSANGALSVAAATTCFFECEFDLSAMSTSSGAFSFGFGGTATITSVKYLATAQKSAAVGTPAAGQLTVGTAATATALVSASLIATGSARLGGVIRVNAAGTLIPQVALGVAAAAVVSANSWFRIWPVGTGSAVSFGAWS